MYTLLKAVLLALAATSAAIPVENSPNGGANSPPAAAQAPPAASPNPNLEILKQLAVLPTAVDRYKLLFTKDGAGQQLLEGDELNKRLTFDFNNAKPANGARSRALAANVGSFPFLFKQGLSTTVIWLEACEMNTPHVHNRAAEWITTVEGTVEFGMVLENGVVPFTSNAELAGKLKPFQGTLFPQGSMHYQFNSACERTTFVATLSNEDPGTNQIAQAFFDLNGEVVKATLGYPEKVIGPQDVEEIKKQLPANLAARVESCYKRCYKDGNYKGGEKGGNGSGS